MYIYRIENGKGRGCYRNTSTLPQVVQIMARAHNKYATTTKPVPRYDKGINRCMEDGEVCGFKDLEQAYKWFSQDEIDMLYKNGFTLSKVYVSRITARGQYQILAIREEI